MAQVARNLTDHLDGFLRNRRYLILDNDVLFTAQFVRILKEADVKVVRTACQSPDMNSIAERWVRSIKSESLDRMILSVKDHSREPHFTTHYNLERPHQGLDNELISGSGASEVPAIGEAIVSERLGGWLKHYYCAAA